MIFISPGPRDSIHVFSLTFISMNDNWWHFLHIIFFSHCNSEFLKYSFTVHRQNTYITHALLCFVVVKYFNFITPYKSQSREHISINHKSQCSRLFTEKAFNITHHQPCHISQGTCDFKFDGGTPEIQVSHHQIWNHRFLEKRRDWS